MKTSLIQLRIGDPIIYEPNERNIQMIVEDIKLTPNGINDSKLVALIIAKRNDGFMVEATSDKFILTEWYEYSSVYNTGLKI